MRSSARPLNTRAAAPGLFSMTSVSSLRIAMGPFLRGERSRVRARVPNPEIPRGAQKYIVNPPVHMEPPRLMLDSSEPTPASDASRPTTFVTESADLRAP